jgi:3-oxoadipate enol-lactonase
MPIVTVNHTPLHYLDRGPRDAPAVLLVHGFPLDSRMWRSQTEELSRSHRVVTPDLRGFGQSHSSDAFTLESLADDLHALIQTLRLGPVVLGGLSMGGYTALAYVRKYPGTLRGLMLVDTRAEADTPEAKDNRGKMIELVRAQGAKAVAAKMLEKLVAPDTLAQNPHVVAELRSIMEACRALTIEHALTAMRDRPDRVGELGAIAMPTLILVGELDAITPPPAAQVMHRTIPRSKYLVIPGAGHMAPMERAQQVNDAMAQFLTEIPGAPSTSSS